MDDLNSFPDSGIDPSVIRAYLDTDYLVPGDQPVRLRIGIPCPALAQLHQAYRVNCSALVTACNPYSQRLDDAANTQRQAKLAQMLKQRALEFLDGIGRHPDNTWPAEPSYLILGLDLEVAKALGNQLQQNAIVWNGTDAIPHLILLR